MHELPMCMQPLLLASAVGGCSMLESLGVPGANGKKALEPEEEMLPRGGKKSREQKSLETERR